MSIIKNYELKRIDEEYVLVVYIKPYFVEFAAEKGDLRKVETLKNEISGIINKNLKKTTITACKIMLGSVLLATIPATQLPAYASTATQETSSSYTNYTVKSGDTLWKISNTFGVPIEEIQEANNMQYTTIYTDQTLILPTENHMTYVVEGGDTLYKIATKYNTTVTSIKGLNNLSSDMIYPGQELIIENHQQTTSQAVTSHTVQSGDTLWKISIKYGVSVDNLKAYNGLTSNTIYAGQDLKLVGDTSDTVINDTENTESSVEEVNNTENTESSVEYINYTIQSGDNIWSVAIDHNIPMSELLSVNNLTMDSMLSLGQEITIPVHTVAVMSTQEGYGEYMDWWEGARYVFSINKVAMVTDIETGRSFEVKRTVGENHADCEPLTSTDASIAKDIWGGYSWETRAVIVEVDGREIAASMSYMPHDIQYITNNDFDGHFDIHFLNSTRHVDGQIDENHQEMVRVAAGLTNL
jgi:LysM repeat protein